MEKYSCVPHDDIFDFWIANNLNALFYGRHGVGKTSMIIAAFERNNLRYQTFSASTMDPWVDFIGVPKEVNDERGSYLELIRPKAFRDDEIEALFFDELNRSHKKIRNAIMELIQFKSINGRKFPKLRFVWGAVNPDEDDSLNYDVEKLDPAQSDRFHVHVEIPYKPHAPYFREKYGRTRADAAIEWWNQLPDPLQLEVSPRRLEYAIQMHDKGGNLAFVLSQKSNINKLSYVLSNGSILKNYKTLVENNNEVALKNFIENENNYSGIEEYIAKEPAPVLHLLSDERITTLASKYYTVRTYMFDNYDKFQKVIDHIAKSSTNKELRKSALRATAKIMQSTQLDKIQFDKQPLSHAAAIKVKNLEHYYAWNDKAQSVFTKTINARASWYHSNLAECVSYALTEIDNTIEKMRILNSIVRIVKSQNDNLTDMQAKIALNIIDSIVSKTQSVTLAGKTDNLLPTVNKCVKILRNKMQLGNVQELADAWPHICCKILLVEGVQFLATCPIVRK